MGGNCVAVPSVDKFPKVEDDRIPGEIIVGSGNLILNPGRKAVILRVVNTGDRPIQVFSITSLRFLLESTVGSYFHKIMVFGLFAIVACLLHQHLELNLCIFFPPLKGQTLLHVRKCSEYALITCLASLSKYNLISSNLCSSYTHELM